MTKPNLPPEMESLLLKGSLVEKVEALLGVNLDLAAAITCNSLLATAYTEASRRNNEGARGFVEDMVKSLHDHVPKDIPFHIEACIRLLETSCGKFAEALFIMLGPSEGHMTEIDIANLHAVVQAHPDPTVAKRGRQFLGLEKGE